MKKFTKNAYINSEYLKNNEIIKFESHYLRIKEDTFCDNCFFKKNKNYDCYQMIYCQRKDGSTILFEELSEIETLIMFDKYKNDLIKMCNKKCKEFLLREFRSLEVVEIFKKTLENCNK